MVCTTVKVEKLRFDERRNARFNGKTSEGETIEFECSSSIVDYANWYLKNRRTVNVRWERKESMRYAHVLAIYPVVEG